MDTQNIISSFIGRDRTLHTPISFILLTGDHHAATILGQLFYWHEREIANNEWIIRGDEDWQRELLYKKYTVRNAISILKRLGIIEVCVKKHNGIPKNHYKVNIQVINNLLGAVINSQEWHDYIDFQDTKDELSGFKKSKASTLSIQKVDFQYSKSKADLEANLPSINLENSTENPLPTTVGNDPHKIDVSLDSSMNLIDSTVYETIESTISITNLEIQPESNISTSNLTIVDTNGSCIESDSVLIDNKNPEDSFQKKENNIKERKAKADEEDYKRASEMLEGFESILKEELNVEYPFPGNKWGLYVKQCKVFDKLVPDDAELQGAFRLWVQGRKQWAEEKQIAVFYPIPKFEEVVEQYVQRFRRKPKRELTALEKLQQTYEDNARWFAERDQARQNKA